MTRRLAKMVKHTRSWLKETLGVSDSTGNGLPLVLIHLKVTTTYKGRIDTREETFPETKSVWHPACKYSMHIVSLVGTDGSG